MVRSGPGARSSPFIDHDIVKGSSPLMTVHSNCLNSPVLTVSFPKENGRIFGGSKKYKNYYKE